MMSASPETPTREAQTLQSGFMHFASKSETTICMDRKEQATILSLGIFVDQNTKVSLEVLLRDFFMPETRIGVPSD